METAQTEYIRGYLKAIESGATGAQLAQWFHPDLQQQEFPNKLVPDGATRNLNAVMEAAVRGQKVISAQGYEVLLVLEQGNHVAMEVNWTGTLRVPLGKLQPGDVMRARFGVFFTFQDGKIISQRNYDCFEPF